MDFAVEISCNTKWLIYKKNLSPLGIYLSFIGKYSSDTRAYCQKNPDHTIIELFS